MSNDVVVVVDLGKREIRFEDFIFEIDNLGGWYFKFYLLVYYLSEV